MNLINEFGRYDRAGVTQRARELYAAGGRAWGDARAEAYRQARAEIALDAQIASDNEASHG